MNLLILLSLLAVFLVEKATCQAVDIENLPQHLNKREEQMFWKFIRDSAAKSGQTVMETLKEQVPRFKLEHPELATSRRALRLITGSKETQRSHDQAA